MARPRGKGLIARMRLRHKLAVSLSIAALLPVMAVSWVAVSVVLENLDRGVRDETERQLHVGLSLVLRTVERIGADAVRIAGSGDLAAAMSDAGDAAGDGPGPDDVRRFLERVSPHLPSSLVQIFDTHGRHLGAIIAGDVPERFVGLRIGPATRPVRDALGFQNPITIDAEDGVLVVRAAAPVLDSSYRLKGVVVMSVPLDGPFADGVKSALGTDVLIFAGVGASVAPALSTFIDSSGAREQGIDIDPVIAHRVEAGETVITSEVLLGRQYAVGYTALINLEGKRIGILAVAVDRAQLIMTKQLATRSLILGAAGAFAFALLLAGLISRRLTGPLARLHRGALAVARGDLDYRIVVSDGDEIGDLATAFSHMTRALKENQERLAARMRELESLHDAAQAVSSVIDLNDVLRKVVDSVAHVFDVRLCALWLVDAPAGGEPGDYQRGPDPAGPVVLRLGASRAKPARRLATVRGSASAELADPLRAIAAEVAASRERLLVDDVAEDSRYREAATAAGVSGSLMATPLERKNNVVGVLIVGRPAEAKPFSQTDCNLLATFADQAAAAVENARLYDEVRGLNEELEAKVKSRTAELTHMNAELGKALRELRETQAQLILSERMAGLGLLVAGVAHEINSPSAAIAGSVDALADNLARLTGYIHQLSAVDLDEHALVQCVEFVTDASVGLAVKPLESAVTIRRAARGLRQQLAGAGISAEEASSVARRLAELGADSALVERFIELVESSDRRRLDERARALAGYLTEHVFLHRNALTIRNAIRRIQRIVGALKAYSHLDQQPSFVDADVHEGIEDTLVILDYVLRDIKVVRDYGTLPKVPVYVDELNQVWTNLIQNAVQALQGQGQITIETRVEDGGVAVRVIDNGPGIAEDVVPHIFEPFFTTKPKGEGTGLGLGIVRQIVKKHHGNVMCESRPGRTCFRVWLPASQPAGGADSSDMGHARADSDAAMDRERASDEVES